MEKPPAATAKSKNKILKLLPKAAHLAFSPDKRPDLNTIRLKTHQNKGFSGPMVSMIPPEARRKSKNFEGTDQEPTSPKVSCMGQIKQKNTISKKKNSELKPISSSKPGLDSKKKPSAASGIKKIFSKTKSDKSIDRAKEAAAPDGAAPGLGQMRKFASSSETFANFDWTTAQIAPEEDGREFCSDEEESGYSDVEDDVNTPFSAPTLVAGAEAGGGAGADFEP